MTLKNELTPKDFDLTPADHNTEAFAIASKALVTTVASVFVPVVGPAFVDAVYSEFLNPFNQRVETTLNTLGHALIEIQEKVKELTPEKLSQNPTFITILGQAISGTLKTHNEVKIQAFKNIVVNSALLPNVDESKKLIYLQLVDRFTAWHIEVLRISLSPSDALLRVGITPPTDLDIREVHFATEVYEKVIQNFDSKLNDIIVKDLESAGLINPKFSTLDIFDSINPEVLNPFISDFGKDFLKFISEN